MLGTAAHHTSAGLRPTHTAPTSKVVSSALEAPFNIAFKGYGIYVADGGLNQVVSVRCDGTLKTIISDAPGTSGLAFSRSGRYMAYTTTEGGEPWRPRQGIPSESAQWAHQARG